VSFERVIARTWNENRLFSVLLELTYACNLDCAFCYNNPTPGGHSLETDDYLRLLRDLADMQVMNVSLSGGEPMLHPDFFRIGAEARRLGFVVRIKTNGLHLDHETAERVKREIDPFVVEVSVHGASEATHDRLTRVAGSFERLLANLDAMRAAGLRVRLKTVLTAWNEHEIAATLTLADSFGLPIDIDPEVTPRDGGDRSPLALAATRQGLLALLRTESERAAVLPPDAEGSGAGAGPVTRKHCGAGSSTVTIDPYGNVFPCVQWRRPLGNLREQPIGEIWSSSAELRAVRELAERAKQMVDARPADEPLIGFCPGLAEAHTGDPVGVYDACRERSAVLRPALSPREKAERPAADCEGS
jgi:mycofactocin biosynthetic radical S-adenosylmethionine protein MftC